MCRPALPLIALIALACGADGEPRGPQPPVGVELGTGRGTFEPIPAQGGTLELVGGPQGGFHVLVASRMTGLELEGLTLEYAAFDDATGEPVGRVARLMLAPDRAVPQGPSWVRSGDILILDDASPDPVRGRVLEIRVRASEADGGGEATDARQVTIVDQESG